MKRFLLLLIVTLSNLSSAWAQEPTSMVDYLRLIFNQSEYSIRKIDTQDGDERTFEFSSPGSLFYVVPDLLADKDVVTIRGDQIYKGKKTSVANFSYLLQLQGFKCERHPSKINANLCTPPSGLQSEILRPVVVLVSWARVQVQFAN